MTRLFFVVQTRQRITLALSCLILLTGVWGCNSPRKWTSKGDELAAAGLYEEASLQYMRALRAKPTLIEARTGLKRSGQQHLDAMLLKFDRLHRERQLNDAVFAFVKADRFYRELEALRVDLDFPGRYRADYEADKAAYLEGAYNQAARLMDQGQFTEAQAILADMKRVDPNYKDAAQMERIARVIPIYEDGIAMYDRQRFRAAHQRFKDAEAVLPGFRNLDSMMIACEQQLMMKIAILPFDGSTGFAFMLTPHTFLRSALTMERNRFIQLVDEIAINNALQQQANLLYGGNKVILEVARSLGANTVVGGKVLELQVIPPDLRSEVRRGWEGYTVEVVNPTNQQKQTETRYKKVEYTEWTGRSVIRMKVQCQMVNAANEQVYFSDVFQVETGDEVRYVNYDGDKSRLYAGVWADRNRVDPSDKVFTERQERRDMERLLNGRREFAPVSGMMGELQTAMSLRLRDAVLFAEKNRP
jgi:tetratricopeptide (TPR) repeat protein